ncbi:hypothetical protein N9N03_00440 [Chlamydiia bacterium]|nr:hypothetical protein [Chlamydiia bacterium]
MNRIDRVRAQLTDTTKTHATQISNHLFNRSETDVNIQNIGLNALNGERNFQKKTREAEIKGNNITIYKETFFGALKRLFRNMFSSKQESPASSEESNNECDRYLMVGSDRIGRKIYVSEREIQQASAREAFFNEIDNIIENQNNPDANVSEHVLTTLQKYETYCNAENWRRKDTDVMIINGLIETLDKANNDQTRIAILEKCIGPYNRHIRALYDRDIPAHDGINSRNREASRYTDNWRKLANGDFNWVKFDYMTPLMLPKTDLETHETDLVQETGPLLSLTMYINIYGLQDLGDSFANYVDDIMTRLKEKTRPRQPGPDFSENDIVMDLIFRDYNKTDQKMDDKLKAVLFDYIHSNIEPEDRFDYLIQHPEVIDVMVKNSDDNFLSKFLAPRKLTDIMKHDEFFQRYFDNFSDDITSNISPDRLTFILEQTNVDKRLAYFGKNKNNLARLFLSNDVDTLKRLLAPKDLTELMKPEEIFKRLFDNFSDEIVIKQGPDMFTTENDNRSLSLHGYRTRNIEISHTILDKLSKLCQNYEIDKLQLYINRMNENSMSSDQARVLKKIANIYCSVLVDRPISQKDLYGIPLRFLKEFLNYTITNPNISSTFYEKVLKDDILMQNIIYYHNETVESAKKEIEEAGYTLMSEDRDTLRYRPKDKRVKYIKIFNKQKIEVDNCYYFELNNY